MSDTDDRFNLIEMDDGPRIPAADIEHAARDLDMLDTSDPKCVSCTKRVPLNGDGLCESCFEQAREQALDALSVPDTSTIEGALTDIAKGASANAKQMKLGDVANGRATFGVGFRNAEGYIEALRRGVAPRTLREYIDILRRQYGRTVSSRTNSDGTYTVTVDGDSFTAQPLVPATAAPPRVVQQNPQVVAAGQAAAAQAKADQAKAGTIAPPDEQAITTRLTHGHLVAGAVAEGYGILVGWSGSGDMTRTEKLGRLERAGLPKEWAFDAKDPGVQLTRAVKKAAGGAYNCEQEKKKDTQLIEAREWSSRWMLVSRAADGEARVGAKYGDIALVVTLYTDKPEPELVFDSNSNEDLVSAVRKDFYERIGAERYVAADISRWLCATLKTHCESVKYGGNWYVPRRHRATAEQLVGAFKTWGSDWMDPPLPIATTTQLAQGLANGLQHEVDEELRKLEAQRELARKKGGSDVGERAATNFMLRFRAISERVLAYEQLLGADMVAVCREKVRKAMCELEQLIDGGIVERFALIWDEIKRDINDRGGVL